MASRVKGIKPVLKPDANIQAHPFLKGFSTGSVPLTRKAIVPYNLVAVSLLARPGP